ncbi:competence/damage-inducible protein A [Sulfurimonas aquatica]|uniref:Competence/damage-inducible protein A n=1 Tax=Sulfurimonas aquatica TaxID=2672570 RepID=A0A975GCX8_9BACT|nr:molybdopterin-binding protein [Sulfurimonas aquatica]QSZ41739.1 competence/damage-inducible protein A [Sulfurimonas aquatica]
MNFYAVIIGTEILNGRREDKHFEFLKKELTKFGHTLYASFVIEDNEELITNIFNMVKDDKDGIMFSFGGIGSTPDDLTREIASKVFTGNNVITHEKFLQDILDRFKDEAYPYRVHMADLPPSADLLFNPINNMSGFSLSSRYFFVPGFPSMAHPMIIDVIKKYFSDSVKKFRHTLLAKTSENTLIPLMQKVPSSLSLSSLPIFIDSKPNVELSLEGENESEVKAYFNTFIELLENQKIVYKLI